MIGEDLEKITLTREQYAVYSCVSYFYIFHHPIKFAEIFEFSQLRTSTSRLESILDEMVSLSLLYRDGEYYYPAPSFSAQINKRRSSEKRFGRKQKLIRRFATFISKFPFVESVAISGSCSKGLLDEEGDVDYFIITRPGRLWLCRTLLILFKKIFLLNSKKYFCLNYFLSSDAMEIPDRNIFVASEIRTLLPVSNPPLFEKFLERNKWTEQFLPNKSGYSRRFLHARSRWGVAARATEFLLDNPFGDWLETRCYRLTFATWRKRYTNVNRSDFDLNFRSSANVSKHHPRGFQKKVLFELEKKLNHVRVLA